MTPTGDSDHGAQLVFRADPMGPPALIQLPGIGVGVECPGFLHAKGPVTVGDRTVPEVEIWYALDVARMRYKVARLCLAVDYSEDEIDAELLRSIRWAQMAAPGLDTFGRIVVVGPDGVEERHRSLTTLTTDQQTAAVWLRARIGGADPNKRIAEELGISTSAAAQRVRRLRDKGILAGVSRGQRR